MNTSKITIIGAGNMGKSLLAGLINNQFLPSNLWVTDPDKEKLAQLAKQFNIQTSPENAKAIQLADVVVLAVKPQIISEVVSAIAPIIQQKKSLIISIAAGVREEQLQNLLGGNMAIVRCMPNTPALIGAGATGLYANRYVNPTQYDLAESILKAVGVIVWLKNENDLDAVTALSGSGPAYFFLVMEALQAAGVKLGLSPETARLLTLQTALGAARMAVESIEPVNVLRQQVTSPGGTTEAAIRVLEQENLREILTKAAEAANLRSKELAKLLGKEVH